MTSDPRPDLLLARSKRLTKRRHLLLSAVLGLVPVMSLVGGADAATASNLLTANQQSIETSTAGWGGQLGTRLDRTSTAYDGRYGLNLRSGSKSAVATTTVGTGGVRVTPGETLEGSARVRPGTVARAARCELRWYGSTGDLLSASAGAPVTEVAGTWQQVTCRGAAPAGAATVALATVVDRTAWREVHRLDDAWLVRQTTPAPTPTTAPPTTAAPSTTERNLLTVDQAGVETSASGWATQGNAAIDRSTATAYQGSGSLRITGSTGDWYTDATRTVRVATSTGTAGAPVTAGRTYEGRIRVRPGADVSPVRCELRWYTAGGDILDTSLGQLGNEQAGTWVQRTCRAAAPTGAAFAAVRVFIDQADTGDVHYVDDAWLVEVGATGTTPTTAPPTTTAPTTAPPTTTAPTTAPPTTTAPTTAPPTTAPPTTTPPPPTSGAGCAAFPAFPDASCTGWRHTGVTLSPYTGPTTITTPGTVIDGRTINGGLVIRAANVTIRRSLVNGTIDLGYGEASNVLIEDVEINGGNTTYAAIGSANFTCRRCDIHSAGQGISGYNFTLEDSWIHDLYGTGVVHSEAILGYGGNIVVRHNRLSGNYNGASGGFAANDGGMSSSVSFYTHGSWGPINNVVFERNRLNVGGGDRDYAGFCLYGGGSLTSNGTFRDNVFVRHPQNPASCGYHGTVADVPSGPGSSWTGNRYEDGSPV